MAVNLIREADRGRPADSVLRQALAGSRLAQDLKAEISRAVFSYYRWRGWLDPDRPLAEQVGRALELAEGYRTARISVADEELAARAVPAWVHHAMEARPEWLRTLQAEPRPWIRARPGRGRALAKSLGGTRTGAIPDALLYLGDADLFRSSEFHAGEFELQDVASQAVGRLCDPKPGETWWDACAGEGGKTLHLSDLMENRGLIWASDRASWRLDRLKRRAARAGVFNYRAAPWDGGPRAPTRTRFDGVLLDAPCSGVGTWHRNPQARWTTSMDDVRELGAVQRSLLAHAAPTVKQGGRLVYAVCTLTRAETAETADWFEGAFPEYEPLPLVSPFAPGPAAARLCLWPQQTGGAGMFVAAWRRGQS